jgi:uncharacterized membrane protein YphA (DoxX/SURF4 family)
LTASTKVRKYATLLLRVVLGAVFVYAAYTKLRDPWAIFAMSIDSYKLLPEWGVIAVARTLPWFELLLGVVLIIGVGLRYASVAGASLLGVFFLLMAISYARGLQIDCGCFGPGEALGPKTLLRDGTLVMLAIALAVLALRPSQKIEAPQVTASA